MSDIHIAWLGIYPIKSCASATLDGRDIKEAYAEARGLVVGEVADRHFMLVDGNYRHITQRERPELARVKIALQRGAEGVIDTSIAGARGMGSFVLDPKDISETRIIAEMHKKKRVGETVETREKVPVHLMDGPGTEWFREFLKKPDVRLVYQTDNDIRISDRSFATGPGKNNQVSLGDGFSILLTTMPTLVMVGDHIGEPKPMNRFRPNMVIDGDLTPNEENTFAFAQYGSVYMHGVKPCTRCVMTGVDQETGVLGGSEILKTVVRSNFVRYVQHETEVSGGVFGENLIPENTGIVHIGDRVTVLDRKPMPEFKSAKVA